VHEHTSHVPLVVYLANLTVLLDQGKRKNTHVNPNKAGTFCDDQLSVMTAGLGVTNLRISSDNFPLLRECNLIHTLYLITFAPRRDVPI